MSLTTKLFRLSIAGALALACTPGPEHRQFYRGEATSLHFHLADVPAAPAGSVTVTTLMLEPVAYCQWGSADPGNWFVLRAVPGTVGRGQLDPATGRFDTQLAASDVTGISCSNGWRGPRFFRLRMLVGDGSTTFGAWTSTQDLVYAERPTTMWLFGPTGPKVSLPVGYSLVHHSCTAGAGMTVTAEPIDTVIELLPAAAEPPGLSNRGAVESAQGRLLAGCGIQPAASDLGTPVSLDAPLRLAWAPDGTRLHYLFAEADDSLANLRTVPASGGAVVASPGRLNRDALVVAGNSDLFLGDDNGHLLRGRPQPDGSIPIEVLSDDAALVSPDGRWLARAEERSGGAVTVLQDLTTGDKRDVGAGYPQAWSPDGQRLAYRRAERGPSEPAPVQIWNLSTGVSTTTGSGLTVQWLADGKLVLRTPDPAQGERMDAFSADGAALGQFHFDAREGLPFWAGDHLAQLVAGQWIVATIGTLVEASPVEVGGPLVLESPAQGARTLVPRDELLPSREVIFSGASPFALFSTRKCLGFYETVCTYQLHRLSLPDGADRVVAISGEPLLAFALSPDQRQVAIGTRAGIFIKALP
jgi:hypothetical protein